MEVSGNIGNMNKYSNVTPDEIKVSVVPPTPATGLHAKSNAEFRGNSERIFASFEKVDHDDLSVATKYTNELWGIFF